MSRTEQMKFPFLKDEDMQLEIGIPEVGNVPPGFEVEMGMEANDWRDKDSDSRVRKYIRQLMKDGIETEEDAYEFLSTISVILGSAFQTKTALVSGLS